MELDTNSILVDLIKGQTETQTMVKGMSDRLFGAAGQPGVLLVMHQENKDEFRKLDTAREKLDTRVKAVEKKVWYFSGFGAAIGTILGLVGLHFKR